MGASAFVGVVRSARSWSARARTVTASAPARCSAKVASVNPSAPLTAANRFFAFQHNAGAVQGPRELNDHRRSGISSASLYLADQTDGHTACGGELCFSQAGLNPRVRNRLRFMVQRVLGRSTDSASRTMFSAHNLFGSSSISDNPSASYKGVRSACLREALVCTRRTASSHASSPIGWRGGAGILTPGGARGWGHPRRRAGQCAERSSSAPSAPGSVWPCRLCRRQR
jgi:hypothetical protein